MDSWNVRIALDPPYNRARYRNHVFGPGDKVSGKVIFSPKSDENVDSIYIEFKGRCKTQDGHDKDKRWYEQEMFRQTATLFKGSFKMRAAVYEYPFSFIFPEKFVYRGNEFRDDGYFKGQVPGADGKMSLPPTCDDVGDYSGEVEVRYHLVAKVPRTFSDWEDKILLNFCPWRTESEVQEQRKDSKMYESFHRHYRVSEEGIPRALSKREVFKEGFKKNVETKTVNFSLEAKAPTQIVLGRNYPVEITVVSKDAEELGIVPEFRIKGYELLLKDRTDVRIPGSFMDHLATLNGHIPLSSSSRLNEVMPVNEIQTFNGMFPKKEPFPPPSFSSWCIRRTYGLELKATIECLGEEERCKIHWMGVKVFPAKMEPGVEEAIRGFEEGTARLAVEETPREAEPLPVYEGMGPGRESLPGYEKHVDGNVFGL